MINATMPPPPRNYEQEVKVPGEAFLASTPSPKSHQWREHRYWREIHQDLYDSLHGICSYCASFTPRKKGEDANLDHTSIDHFIPKSQNHELAYEWSNFRLCRARLNNRKGDFTDVVDPYEIQNGHFKLNFQNFYIFADPSLPESEKSIITGSISRLELNNDDSYVNERARVIYSYSGSMMTFEAVGKFYPFIASEILAQDFDRNYLPAFRLALANPRIRDLLAQQGLIQ